MSVPDSVVVGLSSCADENCQFFCYQPIFEQFLLSEKNLADLTRNSNRPTEAGQSAMFYKPIDGLGLTAVLCYAGTGLGLMSAFWGF